MAKKTGKLIGHVTCQSCGELAEVREPAEPKKGRPPKASTMCYYCDTQSFCKSVTADKALRSRMTPIASKAEPKTEPTEKKRGGDDGKGSDDFNNGW